MDVKVEDILRLKRLVTSNRIASHNIAYNTLPIKKMESMYDHIYENTQEIEEILFKYYQEIFYEC